MNEKIGDRIVIMLQKRGMSQKDLSELTGYTECTISRYIGNQRIPNGDAIIKIAKVLCVTSDYLLGIDENYLPDDTFHVIKQIIMDNVHIMTKEQKLELISMMIK